MNPAEVSNHILRLALGLLRHSAYHAHLISPDNDQWAEMSVVQAAHAGELLIKARIAEVHPLLLFEKVPAIRDNQLLDLQLLAREGRTFQFADLPQRLWAATGIRLSNLSIYQEFGKLRNSIQHFAVPPGTDCTGECLHFVFGVLDPFMHECWGEHAIDYNEDYEPYQYYVEALVRRGILFLPSAQSVDGMEEWELDWPSEKYRDEMERRFAEVRAPPSQ
jgi:hypothetical protein